MEKKIQTQEVLTTGKAVYEKPISQVYELAVEGAILSASGGQQSTIQAMEYDDEWS